MATAIVTLFSAMFLISGIGVLTQGAFRTATLLTDSWSRMEARSMEMADTRFKIIGASASVPTADITLRNTGQESLERYSSWDVLAQYYEAGGTLHSTRLAYAATLPPGDNEWAVAGIYASAATLSAEVFQQGAFDPQEEMVIRIRLSPSFRTSSQNRVIISTPNGVATSAPF